MKVPWEERFGSEMGSLFKSAEKRRIFYLQKILELKSELTD